MDTKGIGPCTAAEEQQGRENLFSDFWKCLRGFGKCFLADVGVAGRHRGGLMAHQSHHDRIGNTGILEEGNGSVAKQ